VLRELPPCEGDPPGKVKIELAVLDTGKVSVSSLVMNLFLFSHLFTGHQPELLEGTQVT
jgi:hypothetical protein